MNAARPAAGSPRDGLGPLFLSSVLFGAMAVGVRVATREMAAAQVAFFRFLGSFLVLVAATGGRSVVPTAGRPSQLVLRGAIGAASIWLYFLGIEGAGAGIAALLQSAYPVFASLLATMFLAEAFTARLGGALLLNLCGAGLVFGGEFGADPAILPGMVAAAGASVLAGAAIATARHLRAVESASVITTWFMAVGALATAPSLRFGLPAATTGLVASVVFVTLTSVAAQWLLHHGLGFHSAARSSLVAATGVATAAALEALVLGRSVDRATVAGAALMFAAVALATEEHPARRSPADREEAPRAGGRSTTRPRT